MSNFIDKSLDVFSDDHMHITVLDDGETFSGIDNTFVVINAVNEGDEFTVDRHSQKYSITELISDYISSQVKIKNLQPNLATTSNEFEEVLERWNELIQDVFHDWQDRMIDSDPLCPPPNNPNFEDYVEENYNYDMFCDISDENKAFTYITQMGY